MELMPAIVNLPSAPSTTSALSAMLRLLPLNDLSSSIASLVSSKPLTLNAVTPAATVIVSVPAVRSTKMSVPPVKLRLIVLEPPPPLIEMFEPSVIVMMSSFSPPKILTFVPLVLVIWSLPPSPSIVTLEPLLVMMSAPALP